MNNFSNAYGSSQSTSMSSAFATLMRNVYIWMTLGLVMTGMTAYYVAQDFNLVYTIASNQVLFWGLMIGELALVWYLSARIMKLSMATAGIMFALYSVLNGVTMSFIFLAYTMESIAQTFFITAGTFAAMSVAGFFIKKDLSTMGRVLMMALIGVIIATIVNIWVGSSGLAMIINYLGVLIFVGLTAYDTQKIKQMLIATSNEYGVTNETSKIALMGSLALYLDFINLFLYLLRFFGDRD